MDRQAYWDNVYRTKGPDQVSWYQAEARLSLTLIEQVAPARRARIIDIGAGASPLVDGLLGAGFRQLTVVDLSATALARVRQRLGDRAEGVTWIAGDVLSLELPAVAFDVWHDRAAFHFLTEPEDRARYVAQVRHAVSPGGHVLVATFADDGPTRCSGLAVARYSPAALQDVFGAGFRSVESQREVHVTPSGGEQAFTYCLLKLEP